MTDTHAENGHARPIAMVDLLADMDKNDYPELEFVRGNASKRLRFTWAEDGLIWLYRERPQVFADMMLAITGIDAAPVKAAAGNRGK